jgi:hypothetical protein
MTEKKQIGSDPSELWERLRIVRNRFAEFRGRL